MWPLDRLLARLLGQPGEEFLRIGRSRVERWSAVDGRFAPIASQSLPDQPPDAAALDEALRTLYASAKPASRTTVVLESAWLPMMLADTGATVWKPTQVEALLRHRFALVHADRSTILNWAIRVDHRPGDRHAIGYGLDQGIAAVLTRLAGRHGVTWSAVVPAWAWGRERWLRSGHGEAPGGWWFWEEQDRLILAKLQANRVVALHTALPKTSSPDLLQRLLGVECVRWGLPPSTSMSGPISWDAALGNGGAVTQRSHGSVKPSAKVLTGSVS